MKRWKLLRSLVAPAVVLAASAFVFWPWTDPVTSENYSRIHSGMTGAEVEAILGPPGDYSTGPAVGEEELWWRLRFVLTDRGDTWIGNSAFIMVSYDKSAGRSTVRNYTYQPIDPADVGLVANGIWRVQRQWHQLRTSRLRQHFFPEQKIRE